MQRIRTRRDARQRVERLLSQLDHVIRQAARRAVADRLRVVQSEHAGAVARAREREVMVTSLLDVRLARPLVQLGLFDRRALRQAERDRQRAAAQRRDAGMQLSALEASMTLAPARELELLLVLMVTDG